MHINNIDIRFKQIFLVNKAQSIIANPKILKSEKLKPPITKPQQRNGEHNIDKYSIIIGKSIFGFNKLSNLF